MADLHELGHPDYVARTVGHHSMQCPIEWVDDGSFLVLCDGALHHVGRDGASVVVAEGVAGFSMAGGRA